MFNISTAFSRLTTTPFKSTILRAILLPNRCYSNAVSKSELSKLRRTTGYAFSVCREALLKNENNYDKALSWLKEEAVSRGWDKVGKLAGRSMTQGLLGVLSNRTRAVIVEVNCETDFVARNDAFQSFVVAAAESVMANYSEETSKCIWGPSYLNKLPHPNTSSTLSDALAVAIGSVGENMSLRRAAGICTSSDPSVINRLAAYSHVSSAGIIRAVRDVQFGKYAAIIRYRPIGDQPVTDSWFERASRLGNQVCQHIVGMNPQPGLIPPESPAEDPEQERFLLWQPFLLDETIRVGEHLERNDMLLEDFIRFECGEEDSLLESASDSRDNSGGRIVL